MRNKILLLFLVFSYSALAQQEQYHPYKKFGSDIEVLTLSNGKYDEFFDTDTIAIVGSAVLNTKTMKVIGFVEEDTMYSEATMEPEVVSRWLSPDPLARQFPSLTPYNFVENSPILKIDPDGLAADDYYLNKKGKIIKQVTTSQPDRIFMQEGEGGDITFPQLKNPNFAMIKVYVDNVSVGHAAIGMDGQTWGYYPSGENKLSLYGSDMSKRNYSTKEFEATYGNANIFYLKVSPETKRGVEAYLRAVDIMIDSDDPPEYKLFSNNCTTKACDALQFGNINIDDFVAPRSLNNQLEADLRTGTGAPVIKEQKRSTIIAKDSTIGRKKPQDE